jgi:DNA-binding CsgD family transcriptional regulator
LRLLKAAVATRVGARGQRRADPATTRGTQCDPPKGGLPALSILITLPVSVMTKAVLPMNSSDVGRSRPSTTDAKLPSFLTRRSLPVSADAGAPAFSGITGRSQIPCDRAYSRRQSPNSTSTIARRSLAPVYVTPWVLAGSIALWCALGVAMTFSDMFLPWSLRGQLLINPAAMAAAAGILVVFLRSATARGAAGRLALDLDTSPLGARQLEDSVRSALGDPEVRLLFRDQAGTTWIDSHGATVSPAHGRSITTFEGVSGSALEHDVAIDDNDPAVVAAVAAVAGLALEAERLRVMMRAGGDAGPPKPDGTRALSGVLTAREREVLALVAQGMTDRAIAQRLYLTRRTVETHLGHVFAKLDLPAGSNQNRRVHAVRRYLNAPEEPRAPRQPHEIP